MVTTTQLPLPSFDGATVVVPAPGSGPGNWAGAASAVLVDGVFWLTWRERRPLSDGRGVAVIVARSDDGVRFTPVTEIRREEFGAESFERPVLVRLPGVGWRLYLSCATPDTKHWWVDTLTAATPEEPATTPPRSRTRSCVSRPMAAGRCGCAATRSIVPATRTG